MDTTLEWFRVNLERIVLDFLWAQWSRLNVMAAAATGGFVAIDPEVLILLTLQCARRDPRIFDAAIEWLHANGKWISITRMDSLLISDAICEPTIVGAAAALLGADSRNAKWRNLAKKHRPREPGSRTELFDLQAPDLVDPCMADPVWREFGWIRPPFRRRGVAGTILSASPEDPDPAKIFFKSRAIFGLTIRADVFAFLASRSFSSGDSLVSRGANPSHTARALGYSQRRVQETLDEMAQGGAISLPVGRKGKGNPKIYLVERNVALALGFPAHARHVDWRAFASAIALLWQPAFRWHEARMTPKLLDLEIGRLHAAMDDDLARCEVAPRSDAANRLGAPDPPVGLLDRIESICLDWSPRPSPLNKREVDPRRFSKRQSQLQRAYAEYRARRQLQSGEPPESVAERTGLRLHEVLALR